MIRTGMKGALAVLIVALAASTAFAQTDVISVNMVGHSTNGASVAATDNAGVVSVANWNNFAGAAMTGLVDANGDATTATFSQSAASAWYTTDIAFIDDAAGNNAMMTGHVYVAPNASFTSTMTNIPYAEYDVYVYYNGAQITNRTEFMTISGTTLAAYEGTTNNDTHFVLSDGVADANYVVFEGLTSSDFDLTVTGTWYSYISGVQVAAVPEPATICLLAMGSLGLLRRKRA